MKFNLKNINFQNKFLGLIAALLFGVSVVDNHDPYIATRIAESSEYPSRKSTYTWADVFKRPQKKASLSSSKQSFKQVSSSVDPNSIQGMENLFDEYSAKGINFNTPVKFEYYFYNNKPEQLEQMANAVAGQNFSSNIYQDHKSKFWLKLEEIAIHTPQSFYDTDEMLYDMAKSFRIRGYDGYEIKKLGRFIKHPDAPENTIKDYSKTSSYTVNTAPIPVSYPTSTRTKSTTWTTSSNETQYNKYGRPTTVSRDLGTPNTRENVTNNNLANYTNFTKNKASQNETALNLDKVKTETKNLKEVRKEIVSKNVGKAKYRSNSFRRAGLPYIVVLNTSFDNYRHKREYKYIIDITTEYPIVDALELPTQDILGQLDGLEGQIEDQLNAQGISHHFIGRTTTRGVRRIYYATNEKDSVKDLMRSISNGLNFQYSVRKDRKWDIYKELRKDVNF